MTLRSKLEVAVRIRLVQVAVTGGMSSVLEPAALTEARQLAGLLDGDDVTARHMLGWLHWYRCLALPDGRNDEDAAAAVAMFVPCFVAGASPLPERLLPLLADHAEESAAQLLQSATDSQDGELVLTAARLWQRLADATPDEDPSRPQRLCNLSVALRERYWQTGELADLDAAIAAGQDAADGAPDRGQLRAFCFANLGNALRTRFEATKVPADLDDSVARLRTAADAVDDGDPGREQILTSVADALLFRYQHARLSADLDAIITTMRSAAAASAEDSRRAYHLDRLGWALYARFERAQEAQDLDEAIRAFEDAAAACPVGDPSRAVILSSLGRALGGRFARTQDGADLDAAIEVLQAAADATSASHPNRGDHLGYLATTLASRFAYGKSLADLEAAIGLFEEAVETLALSPDVSGREAMTARLAEAQRTRAERLELLAQDKRAAAEMAGLPLLTETRRGMTGSLADLDAVVGLFRAKIDAAADGDPSLPADLAALGFMLHRRYERAGNPDDLDAAIAAMQDWVTVAPEDSPFHPGQQLSLADALHDRYQRSGDLADLDRAITGFRLASEDTAGPESVGLPPDTFLAVCLSGLSLALRSRHGHSGDLADLDHALEAGRAAAELAPDGLRASCLSELAVARLARFDQTGDPDDLDAAARASQSAVDATSAGDHDLGRHLSNQGLVRWKQYRRTKNPNSLEDAIGVLRAAVDAEPAEYPGKAVCRSRLATALLDRFSRTADPADLDAAVKCGQAAVDSTPPYAPGRGRTLVVMGQALLERYRYAGDSDDYRAAVQLHMTAVDATSDQPRDNQHCSSSLAAVLLAGRRTEDPAVLDTVIASLQAAVAATPASSPNLPGHLNNLGYALRDRSELTGNQDDLDHAVAALQGAVQAGGHDDPSQADYLANMGRLLIRRFEVRGNLPDIDAAVEALRASVSATLDGDPQQAERLCVLGAALSQRFERSAAARDHGEAVFAFTSAAAQGTASTARRIQARASAASLLQASEPDRAASLFEVALSLLPELAPRNLGRPDQERRVGEFSGLAAAAAAAALADSSTHPDARERAVRALRLLESGRAVLLGQALDIRPELSDLRAQHPELARRFVQLRDRLDRTDHLVASEAGTVAVQQSLNAVAERRRLAGELAATLDQIRAQDRFTSFGQPPPIEELLAEAASGPVVTFNIGPARSDALLLTASGVSNVHLPGLSRDIVIEKVAAFQSAVHRAARPATAPAQYAADQRELLDVLGWLWDAAIEPVLDALGLDRTPGPDEPWPRLWWAPGGMLSLLPLHAAGHHGESGHSPPTALDRVVSSYTPTIRSLRRSRESARSRSSTDAAALIIAMTATPGLKGGAPIPNAATEAGLLQRLFASNVLLSEPRVSSAADIPTKAAVLARLRSCAVAHFACHGFTDLSDPSLSRLLLQDHDTDLLTVASLASASFERAQVAYLSACGTAVNARGTLIDEPIHLTAAFQLAGFPHVIGTLWEISDAVAVEVAEAFYSSLVSAEGTLCADRAADALHHAVRAIRDRYRDTPALWAAYLHAGA